MEKYGTVPQKFTHDWWEYVWMYYKIHIIVVAVIMFFALTTLYQYLTRTEYDMTISYMDKMTFSEETKVKLTELISPRIDEMTGNENIDILYMQYIYNPSDNEKQEVMPMDNYAMQMKFVAELQAGDGDIYLIRKDDVAAISYYAECFADVKEFVDGNYEDDFVIKDETGRPYAYSLKNCSAFSDAEYDYSDLYILVRSLTEHNAKKGDYAANYSNSIKAAQALVGSK